MRELSVFVDESGDGNVSGMLDENVDFSYFHKKKYKKLLIFLLELVTILLQTTYKYIYNALDYKEMMIWLNR